MDIQRYDRITWLGKLFEFASIEYLSWNFLQGGASKHSASVGCLVDPELMSDKQSYTGGTTFFDNSAPSVGLVQPLTMTTPDTAFYQWVHFVLVLQVRINNERASYLSFTNRQSCSIYQGRSGNHVKAG